MKSWPFNKHLVAIACLFFAVAVVFARFIVLDASGAPNLILHWDFASQYYPWLVYASDVLRAGDWPLWAPYVGAGSPHFLNPQNALYSPLTLLVALTCGYTQYTAQLQNIFLLFVAGIGAYALSFALWRSRAGGLVSGLCFALSSALYGNIEHSSYMNTYAMMPWFFLAILGLVRAKSLLALPGLVFVIYALVVSGYPAIVFMTFAWGAAWALFLLWRDERGLRQKAAIAAKGLSGTILALGLAAVFWLPIMLHSKAFTRGEALSLDQALTGGNLSFKHLWGLVFQFLTTQPLPGANADVSMRGLYVGALALPLVAVALLRRRDAWTAALACFSLGAFLMACGSAFFGRVALHLLLPAFNFSRFPAGDSRTLMALGLVLLAGRGMQTLMEGDAAAKRVGRIALMGLAWVLGLGLLVFSRIYSVEDFVAGPLNYVTVSLFLVLLARLLWPSIESRFGRGAFLVLLAIDLGVGVGANITVAGELPGDYAAIRERHRTTFDTAGAMLPREAGTRGSLLDLGACEPANVGLLSKTFFLGEYNPLRMGRLNHLIEGGLTDWLLSGPRATLWPQEAPPASISAFLAGARPATFEILEYRPNSVTYEVELPLRSRLVFNELYFEGWRARWEGNDQAMEEVVGGLRAVSMPAGRHRLTTYFRPPAFYLGLKITGLSALLAALWGCIAWWRRRRRPLEVPQRAERVIGEAPASPR